MSAADRLHRGRRPFRRALLALNRFFRAGAGSHVFRLVPYIPPARIFSVLPHLYDPAKGGPASGLLEVRVTGRGGGTWTLDLQDDGLTVTAGPPTRLPDARMTLDSQVWTHLATGKTLGTEAFMRGRVAVEGDLTLTLKLDACFSPDAPARAGGRRV